MTPVDKDQIRREAIKDFFKELSPAIGISGFFITEKIMQLSYNNKIYVLNGAAAYSPKALGKCVADIIRRREPEVEVNVRRRKT